MKEMEDSIETYRENSPSWYRKIGNIHGFFVSKQGLPKLCIGPHWNYFVCLVSFLVVLLTILLVLLSQNLSSLFTIIGSCIYTFLILNYVTAALINPGIVVPQSFERELEPVDITKQDYCYVCDLNREKNVTHCPDCEVCIEDLDHHCPWTSKCVGKGNINFFYGFLIGILMAFIYTGIALGLQARHHHT